MTESSTLITDTSSLRSEILRFYHLFFGKIHKFTYRDLIIFKIESGIFLF